MSAHIDSILDQLRIPDCRFYYLHISISGMGMDFKGYKQLIDALKTRLPKNSTIVVPSFPFGHNAEYATILEQEVFDFDVDSTPCRVNLFGEIFRRRPDVQRTWHPIFPVACLGPDAHSLCDTAHLDTMPFDRNSIFGRLVKEASCVIGLGVDTNTNSFVHLADDHFVEDFPYPLYTEVPLHCRIYKDRKLVHTGDYHTVTVELRRGIKPVLLQSSLMGKSFFQWVEVPIQGYCLELAPFVEFMLESAQQSFQAGILPPWHR